MIQQIVINSKNINPYSYIHIQDYQQDDKQNQEKSLIGGVEQEQRHYEINQDVNQINSNHEKSDFKKKKSGQTSSIMKQQSSGNTDNCQMSSPAFSPQNSQSYISSTPSFTQICQSQCSNSSQGSNPNNSIHNVSYLSRVRVIKKNLVYVIGIAPQLANEQTLQSYQYFGQYGEIAKIVVNKNNIYNPKGPNGPSFSAYITYAEEKYASLSILGTENFKIYDRIIRASYGTTKYCSFFLKNQDCPNINDCLYLHTYGKDDDYFSKDEMVSNKNIFIDQQKIAIKNIRKYIPEILLEYKQKKNFYDAQSHFFSLPNLSRILEKLKDYGAITIEQLMACRENPQYIPINPQIQGIYHPYPPKLIYQHRQTSSQAAQQIYQVGGNELENNSNQVYNQYYLMQQDCNYIQYVPQTGDPSQHIQQQQYPKQRVGQYYPGQSPPPHPMERIPNIPFTHNNQVLPPPLNNYYYPSQSAHCYSPYSPANNTQQELLRNQTQQYEFANSQQYTCSNSYIQIPSISPFEINDLRQTQKKQDLIIASQIGQKQKITHYQTENQFINLVDLVQIQPQIKLSKLNSVNKINYEVKDNNNNGQTTQKQQIDPNLLKDKLENSNLTRQKYEQDLKDQSNEQEKKTDINNLEYPNFLNETVKINSQQKANHQIIAKQSEVEGDSLAETFKDCIDNQSTTSYESGIPTKSISVESEKVEEDIFQPMYLQQKSSKVIQNLITELSSNSSQSLKSSESLGKIEESENSKIQELNTPTKIENQFQQQLQKVPSGFSQARGESHSNLQKVDSGNKICNPNYELIAYFWDQQKIDVINNINSNSSKPNGTFEQSEINVSDPQTQEQENPQPKQTNISNKLFYTYESDQSSFQELCSGFNTFVLTKYY